MLQQQKAKEQSISLSADYIGFGEGETIYSDELRLKQVLLNLQSNALKFTKEGSVVIRSELRNDSEFEQLTISVCDTGIGIPYADHDKLFKLFGFIKSTESVNKNGVGLGLVISK